MEEVVREMRRSRVCPWLWVGKLTCCWRWEQVRRSDKATVAGAEGTSK